MENKLSPELAEKFKACKSSDEARVLAQEAQLELTDEELAEVTGGTLLAVRSSKKDETI